jgi:anaerobic ribonucleoside-triphosphate reductase activating protein
MNSSTVNGPGKRAVIWTQGCVNMNCAGCWNPETHAPDGGTDYPLDALLGWINAAVTGMKVDGVTFSGGEPMQQPRELMLLIRNVLRQHPNLSIGMFSGYTEAELERFPEWPEIRACLDWAVLGRYNQQQACEDLPLRSSRNQQLRLFSPKHAEADFEPLAVELTIDADGFTQITGFPVKGNL